MVKRAESRGPRLFHCIKDITDHIVRVLTGGEFLVGFFMTEYSSLLSDFILNVPAYCQLAKSNFFKDLFTEYRKFLLSSPPGKLEHQIQARTLYSLITSYPMELHPFLPQFRGFFYQYFKANKEYSRSSLPLYSALNHILLSCAVDMGHVVRAIGAELHEHLLFRLRTVSTDEQLKDQIVIFFRLQLRLQVSFTGEILSSSSSSTNNSTNEPQASPSVPKTPEPLSAKRKRVADDEDALHERLLKDPRGYGVDYLESLFDAVLKEMGRHNTTYHLSSTKRRRNEATKKILFISSLRCGPSSIWLRMSFCICRNTKVLYLWIPDRCFLLERRHLLLCIILHLRPLCLLHKGKGSK